MNDTLYTRPEDYDAQYAGYDIDIPFYVDLAEQYAGSLPIIEYGCGTGRITIPLARAGYKIYGIDISRQMLHRGRGKVVLEKPPVPDNAVLIQGNMVSHKLDTLHKLVIVPFTAFLHLTETSQQRAALLNFNDNLEKGGYLLVDIFNPHVGRLADSMSGNKFVIEEKRHRLPNGELLVRYHTGTYDPSTQRSEWRFYIEVYNYENQLTRKYTEEATVQVIFPNEWRLLLELTGFKIIEEWGDYNRGAFTSDSNRMLFLAQKG
jgi:SAM-dependent methyltransferase